MISFLLIAALAAPPDEAPFLAKDGVIAYAAPERMGFGTVVGNVEVSADGKVLSSAPKEIHGYPLDESIYKWTFAAGKARTETVTVVFEKPLQSDCEHGQKVWYESPLTLHVQYTENQVLCFGRVSGVVPEKECELHHVAMRIERVPIRGSGPPVGEPPWEVLRMSKERWDAIHQFFPNAWHYIFMGDALPTQRLSEIYVCPRCREAEEEWLKAHPGQ